MVTTARGNSDRDSLERFAMVEFTPHTAPTSAGIVTAAEARATPGRLDAATMDQLFTALGKADQPLSFAGHKSQAHKAPPMSDLDLLAGDLE